MTQPDSTFIACEEDRPIPINMDLARLAYSSPITAAQDDVRQDERQRIAARLRRIADQYERDGEPGPLGYNFWGWRDMARTLRKVAAELETS